MWYITLVKMLTPTHIHALSDSSITLDIRNKLLY